MAGPGDLHALCEAYLGLCANALDSIPTYPETADLLGAPTRQFISPSGPPVWDCCDQLGVWATPLVEADTTPGPLTSGHRRNLGRINHVYLSAEITRCIPTDIEPPPDELTASARQLNADAWSLWNYLFDPCVTDTLLTLCQEVFFDGISSVAPSGGCGGWIANIRIQLDGYGYLDNCGS